MKSDKNISDSSFARVICSAKIARLILIGISAAWLVGCGTYTPATATVPLEHPVRLTGREAAVEAAMRAAAKHQELTIVGPPRMSDAQTTFMLLGVGGETGAATLTKVEGAGLAAGECAIVVTARLESDPNGERAGRLVADFRDRWEQLRRTGFAPLPSGWQ